MSVKNLDLTKSLDLGLESLKLCYVMYYFFDNSV